MTDADGADWPPESNPRYQEMHERDFPPPAWEHPFEREDETLNGLGEIDSSEEISEEFAAEIEENRKRVELVRGLLDLAKFIEDHPGLELPDEVEAKGWVSDGYGAEADRAAKAKLAEIARNIGHCEKDYGTYTISLRRKFGPVTLEYSATRESVCQKVKVGERYLPPEPAYPGGYEDVFEWQCDESLLAGTPVLNETLISNDTALD